MKKLGTYLIVFSGVIIFIVIVVILYRNNNSNTILINRNDINKILIVNNQTGTAKEITKKEDIIKISDLFIPLGKKIIKKWEGHGDKDGGNSYTFIFIYNTGIDIKLICIDNTYMINNGRVYRIQNVKLEKFWELNYQESKYIYPYIQ